MKSRIDFEPFCIICGKELGLIEKDFCETCLEFLASKYSETKLQEVIKWHKENTRKRKK